MHHRPTRDDNAIGCSCAYPRPNRTRRAFSLTELVVVLSVTVMLTSLLFPAMAGIRENARRIICASNIRQQSIGITIYTGDWRDRLPNSTWIDQDAQPDGIKPWELMAARHEERPDTNGWDGVGLLHAMGYCSGPECYYCPSHRGEHPVERYEDDWEDDAVTAFGNPTINPYFGAPLYTNYHYAGDVDWIDGSRRRLEEGFELVLLTDGLRTVSDFNHVQGMNMLRADGSVGWSDQVSDLISSLPQMIAAGEPPEQYPGIWQLLDDIR